MTSWRGVGPHVPPPTHDRGGKAEHRCGRCYGPFGRSAIPCPNDQQSVTVERIITRNLEERHMSDDEQFCARCFAGVDSSEHHSKCVVAGYAEDGEGVGRC